MEIPEWVENFVKRAREEPFSIEIKDPQNKELSSGREKKLSTRDIKKLKEKIKELEEKFRNRKSN